VLIAEVGSFGRLESNTILKYGDRIGCWEYSDPRLFEKAGILFFIIEELTGREILKKSNGIWFSSCFLLSKRSKLSCMAKSSIPGDLALVMS
jgi:hypothetical protein